MIFLFLSISALVPLKSCLHTLAVGALISGEEGNPSGKGGTGKRPKNGVDQGAPVGADAGDGEGGGRESNAGLRLRPGVGDLGAKPASSDGGDGSIAGNGGAGGGAGGGGRAGGRGGSAPKSNVRGGEAAGAHDVSDGEKGAGGIGAQGASFSSADACPLLRGVHFRCLEAHCEQVRARTGFKCRLLVRNRQYDECCISRLVHWNAHRNAWFIRSPAAFAVLT